MIVNACPSDVTGRTTMAIPCGRSEGLSVSVMLLVGKCYEATVPRVARAFEGAETYPSGPNVSPAPVSKSW